MTIGQRLAMERRQRLTGRGRELAAVSRLLDQGSPLRFLYLSGPGGSGKGALLAAASARAAARGYQLIRIDGREQSWTGPSLLAAAMAGPRAQPRLVAVRGFEAIAHLEGELRERCLPRLPDSARVIAAGRVRLTAAWRRDPGWRVLAREIALASRGSAAETSDPVSRLDRDRFARVVRDALRACDRPDLLHASPLRSSRWNAGRAETDPLAAGRALSAALREECRRLFASPRDLILDRVIDRTFFHPLGKQEVIAAELGLAYSTYRRYLAQAIARLAGALHAQVSD